MNPIEVNTLNDLPQKDRQLPSEESVLFGVFEWLHTMKFIEERSRWVSDAFAQTSPIAEEVAIFKGRTREAQIQDCWRVR